MAIFGDDRVKALVLRYVDANGREWVEEFESVNQWHARQTAVTLAHLRDHSFQAPDGSWVPVPLRYITTNVLMVNPSTYVPREDGPSPYVPPPEKKKRGGADG